jgi:hypothetical protein
MALAPAFASLLLPCATYAQNISKTATAGVYSVTLKVLPAESFEGSDAEMMRDGGARADMLNEAGKPNHHLVAFIEENGQPVEDATVTISYRQVSPENGKWMSLPVARMHVAHKSMETTHYGNNVELTPGSYEARVSVNGKGPAIFRFSL